MTEFSGFDIVIKQGVQRFEQVLVAVFMRDELTFVKAAAVVKYDSWFSHLAVEIEGENTSNEWLQPVDE